MQENNFSRLFNSSLWMTAGICISGVFSMLTRIGLGRILQPEKYGMLSEGLAVLNFFIIFSLLGTTNGIPRLKSYGGKVYNAVTSGLVVCVPLSLLSCIFVFNYSGRFAALMGNPALESVFKVLALNIPGITITAIFVALMRGNKKTKDRVLISDVITPAVILIGSIIAVYTLGESPENAALGYLASSWIGAIAAIAITLRNGNILALPSKEDIRELLTFSYPLMFAGLFSFGVTWSNILFLGYFLGSESAGLYNAALPLTYIIGFLLFAINYLFLPIASTIYSKNNLDELKNLYHTATRWLLMVGVPLFAVLFFKQDFVMTFVYGASYAAAAPALGVLALSRLVNAAFGPIGQLLIATGKPRAEAITRGLGISALLIISIFSIPIYGILGACIAYLISHIISNSMRLYFAREIYHFQPFNSDTLKPVVSFLLPLPLLLFISGSFFLETTSIAVYGVSYGFILLALKPFKKEDIMVFQGVDTDNDRIDQTLSKIENIMKRFTV